ncbi:MAG: hypothetical protein JWQ02_3703 [Capsulimonas sp.]|nr:hypothetical protein [Capsulimonas sp.]
MNVYIKKRYIFSFRHFNFVDRKKYLHGNVFRSLWGPARASSKNVAKLTEWVMGFSAVIISRPFKRSGITAAWDPMTIIGGGGHNLPQEASRVFADAIIDVASF